MLKQKNDLVSDDDTIIDSNSNILTPLYFPIDSDFDTDYQERLRNETRFGGNISGIFRCEF